MLVLELELPQSAPDVPIWQRDVLIDQAHGRGFGTYNATTTYVPGPTIVSGSHDRSLGVVMFRNGEPGAENALDARQALGAEWQEIVKSGVHTCLWSQAGRGAAADRSCRRTHPAPGGWKARNASARRALRIVISFRPSCAHDDGYPGGCHDDADQVLHLVRERSACRGRSGAPVLRSGDPGIHVMLSQSLYAAMLIAVVLAVYILMIKTS
jgi:hypothetical protein